MAHGYPYPCQRKTGHTKLYEIRCSISHDLLYIGVTDSHLNKRCSANENYRPDCMYYKELARFDDRKEAEAVETLLLKKYNPPMNLSYGHGFTGLKQSAEHIAKKVKSQAWYKHQEETKLKIGKANGFRVKCVETGDEFYSMAEAARWCGGNDSKISLVTRGKRKTHKGYHWELI